jgi:hypothetical protein
MKSDSGTDRKGKGCNGSLNGKFFEQVDGNNIDFLM